MSFSIVVALAALGLAGVAALALRRPRELVAGGRPAASWPPAAGRAGGAVRAVAGLVGFSPGAFKRTPGRGRVRAGPAG